MQLKPDTLAMTTVLAFLTALGPLSTDMYLPSLPAIARDLGATAAQTQLTLSAFLFGFAVGQLFYGPIADKIGRRPVLLFGLGLFLAATLACTLAPGIGTLTGARFCQALGASGPIVLGRAMVRDLYEGPRAGRELSRMGSIMGVVPAIAPVFGGVLQDLFGWRSTFATTLIVGAALAATVAALLPETLRARSTAPLSFVGVVKGFGTLLRHRGYRVYVALVALTYGGLFAFISGSSFVLQDVYGLSEIAYGFSFGLTVIGFISGTMLAQRLVGRRGLDGTIARGVACLALGGSLMLILVAAGVPSSLAVTMPMAIYGMGVGLTMPQATAAAMAPFPGAAGAASSFLGICQMSFAALVGIGVGHAMGGSALPLPIVIATTGLVALAVFHGSAKARRS
ncbi:MAG TPA: multidrug effflux MFS transporter [Beijerinckiaceae bacterium]|nr:multidrug effflux MFS transporter [Beijerinckiaceae bacterium]